MANCMATVKITITLQDKQIEEIRKCVAVHESASVSGFVQRAVQRNQGLMETGGPLTAKERAWAQKMLSPQKRRTTRKPTPENAD